MTFRSAYRAWRLKIREKDGVYEASSWWEQLWCEESVITEGLIRHRLWPITHCNVLLSEGPEICVTCSRLASEWHLTWQTVTRQFNILLLSLYSNTTATRSRDHRLTWRAPAPSIYNSIDDSTTCCSHVMWRNTHTIIYVADGKMEEYSQILLLHEQRGAKGARLIYTLPKIQQMSPKSCLDLEH